MYISASTGCFPYLSLDEALERLAALEYTKVEIPILEHGGQLRPSQVAADLEWAIQTCRMTQRMMPVAFTLDIDAPGEEYYQQFYACCRLAKAVKVVAVTVRSAELGTPFNAEIERLRRLVSIATAESVLLGVKTETDRMTQDPDTAAVLCDNVKGLGITLDPSHYICGPHAGSSHRQLLKYVNHVQLRDTTRQTLQVRVGQGEVDYGKLIAQLGMYNYSRALSVDIVDARDGEIDHAAEMRKLRLLLESLL